LEFVKPKLDIGSNVRDNLDAKVVHLARACLFGFKLYQAGKSLAGFGIVAEDEHGKKTTLNSLHALQIWSNAITWHTATGMFVYPELGEHGPEDHIPFYSAFICGRISFNCEDTGFREFINGFSCV
jgi:hypothetical protein